MKKEYLIQKYIVEGMSYADIAKENRVNKSTVYYYIKKYKIKVKAKEHLLKNVRRGSKHPCYGKRGNLSWNHGKHHSKETKQKISEANKGKHSRTFSQEHKQKLIEARNRQPRKLDSERKTPLYRAIRILPEYKLWRKTVFERDDWACQICHKRGSIILNADHIEPLSVQIVKHNIQSVTDAINCKELWSISNGRTLCNACHKQTKTYGGSMKKIIKEINQ